MGWSLRSALIVVQCREFSRHPVLPLAITVAISDGKNPTAHFSFVITNVNADNQIESHDFLPC